MRRYAYKQIYAWSSDIAYIVGLMTADGCLINNGRHLNITSKDMCIMETFQKVLSVKSKVQIKTGGYGTDSFQLQFSNVAFYDFLMGIGLSPAKSLTLPELKIPDEWYADFLRGFFDGDGTVYGYRDTRWPNSHMFYTEYSSSSLKFIDWLQSSNSKNAGVSKGSIRKGSRAYKLSYAKKDSIKLFKFMYQNREEFRLSRKYDKFIAFL